jgi:branched-chain amino acid transport system permease protein
MMLSHGRSMTPLILVVLIAIVSPLVMPINIANEIIVFAVFAMATNLVVGVSGLFSFGQAAFFGIGAYTAGYCLQSGLPLLPSIALAVLAGAALAALIGAISIRRASFYFMMLTFAFGQMAYYVALTWGSVTGGEDGMAGIKRPPLKLPFVEGLGLGTPWAFYIFSALLFVLSYYVLQRVQNSALGLVLESAKHNPRRTASLGFSVHRAQIIAFAISGAFAGLAGAMYALLYRFVPIDAVHWTSSGNVVFMVVIGGTSSMLGPIFGAAIFVWLQGLFSLIWARWALLFGLFIILVVFTLPGGIVDIFGKRLLQRGFWRSRKSLKRSSA